MKFYFRNTQEDMPELYDLFLNGVKNKKGEDKPIGTLELDFRSRCRVKVNITEVFLTIGEYIELIKEIEKQFKLTAETEIQFAA